MIPENRGKRLFKEVLRALEEGDKDGSPFIDVDKFPQSLSAIREVINYMEKEYAKVGATFPEQKETTILSLYGWLHGWWKDKQCDGEIPWDREYPSEEVWKKS